MCLTHGKYALVDDEDWPMLNQWKWNANKSRSGVFLYAKRGQVLPNRKHITLSMHRVILNVTDRFVHVDHIDHDGFNNQRSNLRLVTRGQNGYNRLLSRNSTSGFKGVSWAKRHKKWWVKITFEKRQIFAGLYDDPVSAAKAYDVKALELFGEYALTNAKMGLLPI